MPITLDIENADALDGGKAVKLLSAIRASAFYRENRSAYPNLMATVKAKIGRQRTISDATNASPIVITSPNHGFVEDEIVTIDGVIGNETANGTWKVANPTLTTFELSGSIGGGGYTSGGVAIDYVSQHLSAIVTALDDNVGDGTVEVKGGRDALHYSQESDRESLVKEALNTLYDVEDSGEVVSVGQRGCCSYCGHYHYGYPCRTHMHFIV